MSLLTPEIATSEAIAIGGAAALADTVMEPGEIWEFIPTVACWIKQGDALAVATAGDGSKFCPAGIPVYLEPGFDQGTRLSVIQASVVGSSSLTRMRVRLP